VHQKTLRAVGRLHKRLTVQKPSTATNDDGIIHSKSHDGLTRVSAKRRTGAGRRREADDDLTQSWYSMRATAGAAVARYHPATAILSVVTVHLGLLPKTSAMPAVKTVGGIGS